MKLIPLLLAALLLAAPAAANPSDSANNIATLADWEQRLLQNLTGANGVPLSLGLPLYMTGTCAVNTQLGGQATGSFKANGACAAGTLIFNFGSPALNGFDCSARDFTTPANTLTPSAYTTTTFTFSSVTLTASDLVVFSCRAF